MYQMVRHTLKILQQLSFKIYDDPDCTANNFNTLIIQYLKK